MTIPADIGERFDGAVELAGDVDAASSAVPARRGVVLLATAGGEPIVLMTAADMRSRVRARLAERPAEQRSRMPDLKAVTARVLWKLAGGHFETDLRFLQLAGSIWGPGRCQQMVGWKPAWFVHVDADEPTPHFARTRDVFARGGLYLGPMPDGRSAERFVHSLVDAFDLCRDVSCLRRSPHGQRCSYAQMGRCLAPCDGSVPMEQYREVVRLAAEFAAGAARRQVLDDLSARMRQAAGELEFEQAAAIKARIERLGELDRPAYAHVAPADRFHYIFVQPDGRRQVRTFLVCRGLISDGPGVAWPPTAAECAAVLEAMDAHVRQAPPPDAGEALALGLAARQLFSSPQRAGLVLRRTDVSGADQLAQAIQAAEDVLRPARRGQADDGGDATPPITDPSPAGPDGL